MKCPHLQAFFQVGVFFCMNLNQPHWKKTHVKDFERIPNLRSPQITDYFISDVPTCFCSPSPKMCSKKIPTNQVFHKVKKLFGWASSRLWLSIPHQIPTKPSLRMLSTVATPRFGSWAPWMARRNYASVHRSRCQTFEKSWWGGEVKIHDIHDEMNMYVINLAMVFKVVYIRTCIWYYLIEFCWCIFSDSLLQIAIYIVLLVYLLCRLHVYI